MKTTETNLKTFFMNYKLTIIFLFASIVAFSQNPINTPFGYEPGGNPRLLSTPDTVYYTVTGKRTGGMFSSKVALSYTKVVKPYKAPVIVPPPVPNNAPIVNAGADIERTLATGQTSITVQLAATVQDENPSTVTWIWSGLGLNATNISNPIATLTSPGVYTYPVTVKDDKGVAGSDAVNITIKAAPIVTPPPTGTSVADAGADQNVIIYKNPNTNEPTIDVTLGGANTVGTNISWEKVSGGDATTPAAVKNPVITIKAGTYVYRLKVDGKTDDVTIKATLSDLATPPVSDKILLYSSFDQEGEANWGKGWYLHTQDCCRTQPGGECCSRAVTRNTQIVRSGAGSLRFWLKSTDPTASGKHRAEIQGYNGKAGKIDRWYGLSNYVDKWSLTDKEPGSPFQWHQANGAGSPPLAIWIVKGRYQVVHNTTNVQDGNFEYNDIGPVVTGKWVDWVFHVVWSDKTDGSLEVWMDGVKVYTYNGITMETLPEGNYVKLGIYFWPFTNRPGSSNQTEIITYIDEYREGNEKASYEDVKPR